MKIGIVGFGYWGKIILKNLENMGYEDIQICDIALGEITELNRYTKLNDYKKLDCNAVFITTPTPTHYKVCKYFLENKVRTFCEKPLTVNSLQSEELYKIANDNKSILFTDWIFTFNSHIVQMKKDYESGKLGKIKSIFMNRLNLGPERLGVNARWDLAAHDISIIQFLFEKNPKLIRWTDYKRDIKSKQDDSSLGLIEYDNFTASINVSWHYRKKVRECVFEFENYFVTWDDYKRFLQYEDSSNVSFPIYSGNLSYPCGEYSSPLINSINSFFTFTNEDMNIQKKLTIDTIKILEA